MGRDQSAIRCHDPTVAAPTHDRVDAPNAGYCVAAHCHPNAIGPSENRGPASNVKHGPTLNRFRSCVWRGRERHSGC